MEIVILIVILALAGGIVYYVKRNSGLENEKAALELTKTARDTKIELLETERLQNEQRQRDQERRAIEEFEALDDRPDDDFGGNFYPRVRKDPSRLN